VNIQIKNRWNLEVIFECEADSMRLAVELAVSKKINLGGSNLRYSNLGGSDLRGSNLSGSDLRYSDLSGSDLRGSDLSGSNLSGSDLRYSDLSGSKYGDYAITITPLQILGLYWDVLILDTAIKIGCQMHSIDEWDKFDDSTIKGMANNALPFWAEHKGLIISAARLHAAKVSK